MTHEELIPDCGRIRAELTSLLYDELDVERRSVVQEHLETCADCREELRTLGETRKLLARWETPPASEDPRLLARQIAARVGAPGPAGAPRRARLVRLGAMLSGAAAALLFTLSVLNARISAGSGNLQLSFSLPFTDARNAPTAGGQAPSGAELEQRMRNLVAQEVSQEVAQHSTRLQEELLTRCSLMTREELLRLSQAVDLALAENQRAWGSQLQTLQREAASSDLEQRRAITDLYQNYVRPVSAPVNSNR